DIDEVIDYPAFGPHDQVEVAQAHVEIDHDDCLAGLRERGTQGGGRRRLADAALPGCHHHDPTQPVTLLFQSSATTLIVSPSGQAWIGQPRRSASMSSAVLYRPSMARSSASILLQKICAREFPVALPIGRGRPASRRKNLRNVEASHPTPEPASNGRGRGKCERQERATAKTKSVFRLSCAPDWSAKSTVAIPLGYLIRTFRAAPA